MARSEYLSDLLQDLRFSARSLWRRPGFTTVAVLTLALGIGANSAIFSVVDGVLVKPLPYAEPERLARVHHANPAEGVWDGMVSPPDFEDAFTGLERLQAVGTFLYQPAQTGVNLRDGGEPMRATASYVGAGFFPALGVAAQLGRTLQPAENVEGSDRALVVSDRLWRGRFGGDPEARRPLRRARRREVPRRGRDAAPLRVSGAGGRRLAADLAHRGGRHPDLARPALDAGGGAARAGRQRRERARRAGPAPGRARHRAPRHQRGLDRIGGRAAAHQPRGRRAARAARPLRGRGPGAAHRLRQPRQPAPGARHGAGAGAGGAGRAGRRAPAPAAPAPHRGAGALPARRRGGARLRGLGRAAAGRARRRAPAARRRDPARPAAGRLHARHRDGLGAALRAAPRAALVALGGDREPARRGAIRRRRRRARAAARRARRRRDRSRGAAARRRRAPPQQSLAIGARGPRVPLRGGAGAERHLPGHVQPRGAAAAPRRRAGARSPGPRSRRGRRQQDAAAARAGGAVRLRATGAAGRDDHAGGGRLHRHARLLRRAGHPGAARAHLPRPTSPPSRPSAS